MIELRGFSEGYGKRVLLRNANGRAVDGQLTALIGRNGSGKSTLLRAIAGLNTHYTGEILIDRVSSRLLPPAKMARHLAFVTTERPRVANLRCEDAVAMGRAPYTNWMGRMQESDKEAVAKALNDVGMSDYATRTLDKMSDGECQRILIARALAQSTPNILLDEPTSFLDIPGRRELIRLLERLAHEEGKCILFSTHELELATQHCDAIALIATPKLHLQPTAELIASRLIDTTFG